MPNVVRTFIAIELPVFIKTAIAGIQEKLKRKISGIRWTVPDNIHLTLAFLGDASPEDVVRICEALSGAVTTVAPFFLSARGLGAFPGLSRPRVIWTGIGGETRCLDVLSRELNDHLEAAGFPVEKRRFTGHLTLGRAKQNVDAMRLMDCVKEMKNFETRPFAVNEAVLMKSDLSPAGPAYSVLFKAGFRKGI